MFSELATELNALSHGWSGLALGYASVAGPMITAMAKGRASFDKLLLSPIFAIPATLLASIATGAAQPVLRGLGIANGGLMQFAIGVGLYAAVGYAGGRVIAKSASSEASFRRGALVADQEEDHQSRPTSPDRSAARSRAATRHVDRNALTLAGMPFPR